MNPKIQIRDKLSKMIRADRGPLGVPTDGPESPRPTRQARPIGQCTVKAARSLSEDEGRAAQ